MVAGQFDIIFKDENLTKKHQKTVVSILDKTMKRYEKELKHNLFKEVNEAEITNRVDLAVKAFIEHEIRKLKDGS